MSLWTEFSARTGRLIAGAEGWEEPPAGTANGARQTVQPHFSSVEEFVTGYLSLGTEVRTGGPIVWCASWWVHPEAVARLTALWRAWEALRLEPAIGMSNRWTLHFDPHMRVLLDAERGPFASCNRGQHQKGKPGPPPLERPAERWKTTPLVEGRQTLPGSAGLIGSSRWILA